MLSVITRNGLPAGVEAVSRDHGTLNPATGQAATRPDAAAMRMTSGRSRNTAAGRRIASGSTKTHRGENIRIVAGHHSSAHRRSSQRASTAARYAQQTMASTRRARRVEVDGAGEGKAASLID